MNLDEVIAGLLAERYAPSPWWKTEPTAKTARQMQEDHDLIRAKRRRALKEANAA